MPIRLFIEYRIEVMGRIKTWYATVSELCRILIVESYGYVHKEFTCSRQEP